MPTAPATWLSSTRMWPSLRRRRRLDGGGRQAQRQRLRHLPARRRIPACPTRAGRTASIPSSTPTAASRKGRSRWSRCRATSSPPIRGLAALAARAARMPTAPRTGPSCAEKMRAAVERIVLDGGCRLLRAGARRRRRALPGARLQCRASALCRPAVAGAGADGRRRSCCRRSSTPAGACERWPTTSCRSTRCPITTARSGRTTRRSARPAWRATATRDSVVRLMSGTFEAAVHFNMRLPELFCGFTRAPGEAPVAYPVACLPQAWSAGSVFMLMQACLGLEIDGWHGEIHVNRPRLPIGIDHLTIRRLGVGDGGGRPRLPARRRPRRLPIWTPPRRAGAADRAVLIDSFTNRICLEPIRVCMSCKHMQRACDRAACERGRQNHEQQDACTAATAHQPHDIRTKRLQDTVSWLVRPAGNQPSAVDPGHRAFGNRAVAMAAAARQGSQRLRAMAPVPSRRASCCTSSRRTAVRSTTRWCHWTPDTLRQILADGAAGRAGDRGVQPRALHPQPERGRRSSW